MHAESVGQDAKSGKKHGHDVRTNSQAVTTMIRGRPILSYDGRKGATRPENDPADQVRDKAGIGRKTRVFCP